MLANLLHGQWPLAEHGLFDRTHLRWFTKQSIIKLMQDAGLNIQDITPRIFRPEKAKAFVSALSPSLSSFNIDPQELLNGIAPLQYVVRASKQNFPISNLWTYANSQAE